MNDWKTILKADLESKILSEIEKEGGALGMKNLKQFGEEAEIKQTLSKLRKEGKIFMHEDGDIYTHKPEDIEKFGIKFQDDNVKFAYNQAVKQYGKRLKQEIKTAYKFYNRPITQQDLERAKSAIGSQGVSSLPSIRQTGTNMQGA
tara:strand:+ start:53 stop:490 length:438 start_codon:yes stop_codon:yes gene_type:complete